jgi:hypothetical protein
MEVSKETIWSSRELFRAYEFRMIFSGSQANRAMRKVVVISHLAHHEALNVVLLRDGNKSLNGATHGVFAHLLRQAIVEILCHHEVVQLVVTGSGCIDADDEHGVRDGFAVPRCTVMADRHDMSPICGNFRTARPSNRGQSCCEGNISLFQERPSSHCVPGATSNNPMPSVTSTPVRLKASEVMRCSMYDSGGDGQSLCQGCSSAP